MFGSESQAPLRAWANDVEIEPVCPTHRGHTLLSYFTDCPESPDGQWVLMFSSHDPEGHQGDICILKRDTQELITLATDVTVEDAHRQAYQQWTCGGKGIIYQALNDDEKWQVVFVDIATREQKVLTRGYRQIGFGQPDGNLIPLFGLHWDASAHQDLELLNVETGEITTVVTADEVRQTYPDWINDLYGSRTISLFAAKLSPDMRRTFIKLSSPTGQGGFRHPKASLRLGMIVYDLQDKRFLFKRQEWGHPEWHPDSRTIINVPNVLIDSDTGEERAIQGLPEFPGSHPSFSPDGQLIVTDTRLTPFGGPEGHWGVVVAAVDGSAYHFVHRFDFTGGAQSWRPPHPHPTFSADSRRIYFNVNSGPQTILHVAERQS